MNPTIIINEILAYKQALPRGRSRGGGGGGGVGGSPCQAGHARKKRESIGRKYKKNWGLQHIITGMSVVYVVPKRKQNGHVAQNSKLPDSVTGTVCDTHSVHYARALVILTHKMALVAKRKYFTKQ